MIKSAFAEVDETKSCTIVYEKGCCDELFGQRSFVMLIIFFVTHALIYISKRNLTNHTWCVEFVSRFATHMSLLTNNTIKVNSTIAESFLEIARSVAQQWQTDGKSKVLFLMYFY